MTLEPGTRFVLNAKAVLITRLHLAGWAGSRRGVVETVDDERVKVRFRDGQPWFFERAEFVAAAVQDHTQPWEEEGE